jgi:hypothetical protein
MSKDSLAEASRLLSEFTKGGGGNELAAVSLKLLAEFGKVVYQKAIEYTDFPLPEIALYFTDNTILLPSEY